MIARKDAIKQANHELSERLKEDQLWKDEDKHVLRKQNRKEEKEKKKQEVVERKAINKQVYEEEMTNVKSKKPSEDKHKLSRFQIKETLEKQQKTTTPKELDPKQPIIEENVNRLVPIEDTARSVEEAISLLRYFF